MGRVERWVAGLVLAVLGRRLARLLCADYATELAFLWRQVPEWVSSARGTERDA